IRSADYSAQVIDAQGVRHSLPRTEVTTYKGEVKGLPNAQVRMSLSDKGLEGAIISRERRLFIQPARAFSKDARPDDFVLYDAADLEKHEGTCGLELAEEVAAQQESTEEKVQKVVDFAVSEPNQPLTTMKLARIATDADGEYVTAFGGASQANTQIANILNLVDGIYQVEIGVTFQIVQQNTWADQNTDPYTTTNAGDLLAQFRNHWNANFASGGPNAPTRSLAHFFTGKEIDGSTIGIASFGVVCRTPTFAYGLSQRFPTIGLSITAQTVVLTAHEIGHNFAGSHTNQISDSVPGDIDRPCEGTIMEASVGSGSSFCPFSRSQITGHAFAHSSCLTDIASTPPASEDCTSTSLDASGLTAAGNLTAGDCRSPSRGVEYFADRYTFNGTAGQRVAISMVSTSGLDPYLFLIAPDGYVLAQNDDVTDADTNSRIPTGPNTITLPQTGVYTLEATSFSRLQTGTYTITVQNPGCTLTATASLQHFTAAGGNGVLTVTVAGPCSPNFQLAVTPDSASWLVPTTTSSSGNVNINFTVSNNPGSAGRRAFILVGTGQDGSGGIRIPITQSGSAPDCTTTPIAFGQTLNGSLGSPDCHSPVRGNGFFADRYTFTASAGTKVAVQTAAPAGNPDTFLTLLGPDGVVLLTDDDSGGGQTNSRIPGGDKFLTLGLAGTYIIEVTGFDPSDVGAYSVTLTAESGPQPQTVQFGQATANVNENQPTGNVNVTRSGDVSGAATVNYATTDNFGANCATNNGQASAKCDFNTAGGTLRFAAGEASKNIQLSIVNDGYVEGNETFTLTLSNPSGMTLGATTAATITIVDNDATPSNPFENNAFFVRQQYLDFLLREPDTGGFNDWLSVLNNCAPNQGGLGSNPACDRVHVSSGFFRSTEFGERGYWSYRFYHAALGRRPQFAEFVPDLRRLSGFLSPAEEEAQRSAFVADFMARPEFTTIYGGLTNAGNAAQFIATLEQRAGVTLPATATTQPGQPPQFGRQELINKMQSGEFTAAQTLRAFIEQKVVFDAFFFRAFVAMQYFGYLLRDPEDAGYNDWVDVLTNGRDNIQPGDFRHLIFGFVWSVEYRQRFGP
ncbi:MAG TPA: M12 family metallo-peptidase, partial [Pyrinomonadaceae bacterium]|nr:M12 family metallo-peptidase [Pyrinomonadaceae bacterium]